MAAFNIAALKPASSIDTLGHAKQGSDRSAKLTAIRNIDHQLTLVDITKEGKRSFWDRVEAGKRSYTGQGQHVGLYVKVGSTKLRLGDTEEVAVAKGKVEETLRGLRAAIEAGQLDEQLDALDAKMAGRISKMQETRRSKKTAK